MEFWTHQIPWGKLMIVYLDPLGANNRLEMNVERNLSRRSTNKQINKVETSVPPLLES